MDFEIPGSLNDNLKCHSQTFDISSHKLQIHLRVNVIQNKRLLKYVQRKSANYQKTDKSNTYTKDNAIVTSRPEFFKYKTKQNNIRGID